MTDTRQKVDDSIFNTVNEYLKTELTQLIGHYTKESIVQTAYEQAVDELDSIADDIVIKHARTLMKALKYSDLPHAQLITNRINTAIQDPDHKGLNTAIYTGKLLIYHTIDFKEFLKKAVDMIETHEDALDLFAKLTAGKEIDVVERIEIIAKYMSL